MSIPGVGEPPVRVFQFLISIFVLGIGPINYYVLKNKRKLSWLMLTVPVGSVLLAGVLFAYAIVRDGFGIRARMFSVTRIDAQAKSAVTNSRLTMYAGFSSGDGLRFSSQTALESIEESNSTSSYSRNYRNNLRSHRTDWLTKDDPENMETKTQHFSAGWFTARNLHHYLTSRSYDCNRSVKIINQGSNVLVNNQLGTKIIAIAVRDNDGKEYFHEEMEHDTSKEVAATTNDLQLTLLDLMGKISDADPAAAVASQHTNTPSINYSPEREIHLAILRLLRDKQNKRSYVAIVEDWSDLEWGISSPEKHAQNLHIVTGEW
jgi:hypothetical protein